MANIVTARDRVPEWYYQLEVDFGKALHGRGPEGQAYRRLCEKGCDAKVLQDQLLNLSRHPRRKLNKQYKSKDLEKLRAMAARLAKTAKELQSFGDLLFEESFAGLNFERECLDWERPIEIPKTLFRLSDRLTQCAARGRSAKHRFPSAYDAIPLIVSYVKALTGRKHYPELATLIGLALGQPISAQEITMICSRRRPKRQRKED